MNMVIAAVEPQSPLFGRIRPGFTLLAVNGARIEDPLDFRFKTTDESVELRFADSQGELSIFRFDLSHGDDLGLTFEDSPVKICKCDCIFCFVRQQPKGMRRALYVKDEDYRLSFTHGNFVTMSNMSDADLERVVAQRLSPLYISVHTTDDTLRRCMLRNEKLDPILPRLQYLINQGITLHTQVVLCPEINDGGSLDQTIEQLAGLYPGVGSLAVVPVGLTRYRDDLPNLRPYTNAEATEIVRRIEKYQVRFLVDCASRFVWAADEFYVQAGREFPTRSTYEEMPQFENGVGMAREFVTRFNRRRSRINGLNSGRRALFLTGHSAYPFWSRHLMPYLREQLELRMTLAAVPNHFWGETVTVSGLLTGQDLLRAARSQTEEYDVVVVPPNCLNGDNLFLDNLSLPQFSQALNKEAVIGGYDLAKTLQEVFV